MILRHEFIVRWPDHTREEKSVDFVVYGTPSSQSGHSAMALTVGLTKLYDIYLCIALKIFLLQKLGGIPCGNSCKNGTRW